MADDTVIDQKPTQKRRDRDAIALIGPSGGGKTSLLSSLLWAKDSLHSFHDLEPYFVEEVTDKKWLDPRTAIVQRQALAVGTTATEAPVSMRAEYLADASFPALRRFLGMNSVVERTEPVAILDGAGEQHCPSTWNETRSPEEIREGEEYIRRAMEAQSLVVCTPLGFDPTGESRYADDLTRVFSKNKTLIRSDKRYAFVATMYDSLFKDKGANALTAALDDATALERLRDSLEPFRQLITHTARRAGQDRVRIFPVSAHGFVTGNGCANLVGKYLAIGGEEGVRYWQPFFTVDPFMYLITGEDEGCRLAFSAEELFEP